MKQSLLSYLLIIPAFFFIANNSYAATNCTGYDITFNSITITGLTSSTVEYTYEIHNMGTETMTFNKLIIQNYLSDDIFTVPAGGSTMTYTGSTEILAGATFTSQFTAGYTGTFDYTELIVQLSYNDGECNTTNNQRIVCLKPNAKFISLDITEIQTGSYTYNYTIQNTGGDTLFSNVLYIQNYLSIDNAYDPGDDAAGGSNLSYTGKQYLLPNEIFTNVFSSNNPSMSSFSYLISQLHYNGKTECSDEDNDLVKLLQITTATTEASLENNFIDWNNEAKSFTVKSGIKTTSNTLEYKMYNTAGALQCSGTTQVGETTTLEAKSGVYVLMISDEQKIYTKKILY